MNEKSELEAVIIGGANGAGKTTLARQFLPLVYPELRFLNVDEIQREDAKFSHPITAGRELLRRLAEKETARESFALETTLSSRLYAGRLRTWSRLGYRTALHFIEVPSVSYAVRRVAQRVAAGGHSVP